MRAAFVHDAQQRLHIRKPQVHALSCQRMDHVRRITDQRHARRNDRMRMNQGQWNRLDRTFAQRLQRTERFCAICTEPRSQRLGRPGQQRLGQVVGRRPHQRDPVASQRQQGDDALGSGEPLIRHAPVRQFRGEVGDDRLLRIGPVINAYVGLRAHPRLRAVRTDDQLCAHTAAIGEPDLCTVCIGQHRQRSCLNAAHPRGELQCSIERMIQIAILDDPGQRADPRPIGIEPHLSRIPRVIALDHHGVDRRNAGCIERIPDLDP